MDDPVDSWLLAAVRQLAGVAAVLSTAAAAWRILLAPASVGEPTLGPWLWLVVALGAGLLRAALPGRRRRHSAALRTGRPPR